MKSKFNIGLIAFMSFKSFIQITITILACGSINTVFLFGQEENPCGGKGIFIQVLGSGDLELDNNRSAESYVVWIDKKSVLLVNAGSGAATRFDQTGADFADLDAVVLAQTTVAQISDLPALIKSSRRSYREKILPILGPQGSDIYLSPTHLVERITSPEGPYPELAEIHEVHSRYGYRLQTYDIPAAGKSTWSKFSTDQFLLRALPVSHGKIPSLAWRMDIRYSDTTEENEGDSEARDFSRSLGDDPETTFSDYSIVFAMGFGEVNMRIEQFVMDADVIVFTHALPEDTSSLVKDRFLLPSEIGKLADRANARFIILGGRGWRTYGFESQTLTTVQESFDGKRTIIFPDDLDCWLLRELDSET